MPRQSFFTGLGEAEDISTGAAIVAACSGADLAARDLAADIVLGAVGMLSGVSWSIEHHQQLGLVAGIAERAQQTIQRGKASAAAEDAIAPAAGNT